MMELSQVLSWLGATTGIFIGIPQLIKTVSAKKVDDLSAATFILSLINCSCLLVRAVAIQEPAYIFYYAFLILVSSLQLLLIRKYKRRNVPI